MQRIKIGHLQRNWHLDLAKDKNRRSLGARAFLARDFARAIRDVNGLAYLQSRPRFGIFAKFAPLFAKLPKLQTPNAKPLDTSFGAFWQITQIQTSNAKTLEMLLVSNYIN